LGGQSSEQQRLIQTGQLTPFGGRVDETTPGEKTADTLSKTPVNQGEPISGGHSAAEPTSSCSASTSNFHKADIACSNSQVSSDSFFANAEPATLSKDVITTQEKNESQGKGLLRLSSDSFDGLFAGPVPSSPATQSVKKSGGKLEKVGKHRKGKERVKPAVQGESTSMLNSQKEVLEADSEMWESASESLSLTGPSPDGGDWMPSMVEEEESGESEYYTDEELGGEGVGGRGRSRRKRKLRELSSDDSDDELLGCGRRRKRNSSVQLGKHQDDGDEELYRLRIRYLRLHETNRRHGVCAICIGFLVQSDVMLYRRQYEEEKEEEDEDRPDVTFEGGFRVPGSVWHKLYRCGKIFLLHSPLP